MGESVVGYILVTMGFISFENLSGTRMQDKGMSINGRGLQLLYLVQGIKFGWTIS